MMNFFEQKHAQNDGSVSQYYVGNSHLPIILSDLYIWVREEMVWRQVPKRTATA